MSSLIKNVLTLLVLLVVGGLGYYLFVLNQDPEIATSAQDLETAQIAADEFLQQLAEIRSLNLSTTLFSDPRFQSFVDYTEPLPSLPVGRANPFAPTQ